VREHVLRAIEEDQYQSSPPATYVKGFLLAYAKYLKLDPNDVLLRYENVLKGGPITRPSHPTPKTQNRRFPPAQPFKTQREGVMEYKTDLGGSRGHRGKLHRLLFLLPFPSTPPRNPSPENLSKRNPPPFLHLLAPRPPLLQKENLSSRRRNPSRHPPRRSDHPLFKKKNYRPAA